MRKKIHIHGKNICLILLAFLITGIYSLQAQNVCISGDGSAPLTSAMLEVKSTTSGFLVPRMTLAQKTAIASPAIGLLVYQTDGTAGFWYYNGSGWVQVSAGGDGWKITGNTGTVAGTNFIGTTDAIDWVIKTSNTERARVLSGGAFGIGTSTPGYRLEVYGAAGASPAKFGNPDGYVLVGPANSGWSHFITDRARYYFNKSITVDEGNIGSYDENLSLQTSGTTRITALNSNGYVGVNTTAPAYNLEVSGSFGFGNATGVFRSRTESRDNAGLRGDAGAQSGFFETAAPAPAANWPTGAGSWWHLIDCRHSNSNNNYALQIAGSFFDQRLWFRKTNDNAAQPWTELITTATPAATLGQGFSQTAATSCSYITGDNSSTYSGTGGVCSSGYTTGNWINVPGLSVSRTITSGNFVSINVHIRWKTDNYSYWAPETIWFRLLRDGSEIARSSMFTQDPDWYILEGDGNIFYYDAGATAGSHTYSVQTAISNNSGGTESFWVQDGYITIIEIH